MRENSAIELDGYDGRLLQALQRDARQSHVALAETVHLSPSQCARRLQRLEQSGLIRRYTVEIDPQRLGLGVTALVNIALERQSESPARTLHKVLAGMPEVIECLLVAGDADYQLRIVARDLDAFSKFLQDQLMSIPGIASIRSSIVLDSVKPMSDLPVRG